MRSAILVSSENTESFSAKSAKLTTQIVTASAEIRIRYLTNFSEISEIEAPTFLKGAQEQLSRPVKFRMANLAETVAIQLFSLLFCYPKQFALKRGSRTNKTVYEAIDWMVDLFFNSFGFHRLIYWG